MFNRNFDEMMLEKALKRTFKQRGAVYEKKMLLRVIKIYGQSDDRQKYWERYRRKGKYERAPHDLVSICNGIIQTLEEILDSVNIGMLLGKGKLRGRNLLQRIKRLIESGADVNDNSNNGHLPLNIAISKGHREIAILLLNAGADFSKRDKSGLSAFERALK